MANTSGASQALISLGVDGAAASRKDIETVGDALKKLNDSSFQKLSGQVTAIQGRIGGLASTFGHLAELSVAGFSAGAFVEMIRGSIDAADNLNDLKKSTGIAVTELAGLKLASQQSGGDLEGIAGSINKLSVSMGKDAERFAMLGVTSKQPLEAFKQFANVFAALDDPQLRAALAADALGKTWASAAPLLAEGGDRIGEMVAKGTSLAGVTQEMADRADEFNDKLAELASATSGAKMKLANDMLPALTDATTAITAAYEESGKLMAVWVALGALGSFAFTDDFSSAKVKIANLKKELDDLYNARRFAATRGGLLLSKLLGTPEEFDARVHEAEAKLAALQKSLDKPVEDAAAAKAAKEKKDREAKEAKDKADAFMQAEEARKNAAAAAKKEAESYAGLTAAIQTKIGENRLELASDEATTDSQKLRIKVDQELASGKLKLSAARVDSLHALLDEQAATEQLVKTHQMEKAGMAAMQQSAQARNASNAALATEYAMYGKSADAREIAMVAVKGEADLEKLLTDARIAGKPFSEEMIAQLEAERDMRVGVEQATMAQSKALGYASQLSDENKKFTAESISDPKARAQALLQIDADVWQERIRLAGEGTEAQKLLQAEYTTWYANQSKTVLLNVDVAHATDVLQIMAEIDEAAKSAATGMANSFGAVGSAIGGLTTALSGYGRTQAAIAAQLAAATKDAGGDTSKIAKANAQAAAQSAQAQIRSYGDMASAAKGFFKENTTGYTVMAGLEKAFRAAEMVMAVESMAKRIFFKETEVAANTALNATKLTGEAATTAASTGLAATEASAWGVTAVVKAMASLPFPLNFAAGAATLAAVVAIGAKIVGGLSGGNSAVNPNSAAERQKVQGTGTVLGDSTAKSDSIAHAVALTAANTSTQIDYLAGMLTSLRGIETNIGSFASTLLRTTDVSGSNFTDTQSFSGKGVALAGVYSGSEAGAAIGTMILPGIGTIIGTVLGAVLGGKFLGKLMSSVFGGSQSLTDSGFTIGKTNLGAAMAGGVNGVSYADVTTSGGWFSSDKHNTQTSSLGADANKQFGLIISSLADSIKQAGGLLGESGYDFTAKLNSFVIDIGKVSLKGLTGDEQQKALEAVFSKLGDQMAEWAVAGLGQFAKVGEGYLETLARVATDYAKVDASLASIGMKFGAVGIASVGAREELVALAGGIDKLQSDAASFAQNFLSKAEQIAPVAKFVDDQLAALGLSFIKSRDQYKNEVLGLDLTTEAGQKEYTALMALQSAFAATHAATVDLSKTEQEIADERKGLQDQLDQLTMTSAQLLAKQRNALDASNRALFDQVQAAQAAKDAQDQAKTSLGDFINKMNSFSTSARSLHDSMLLGNLSTLTPEQQYAEARNQYQQTVAAARAGDSTAQANLQTAVNAFLTASRASNASDAQYAADFADAQRTTEDLSQWASSSADVAQDSLDALTATVSGIDTLNTTMLSVAQGIQDLPASLAAAPAPALAAPINYSNIGTSDMVSLVTEIKALRASNEAMATELKGLRADQALQTGDLIGGITAGAQQAASTVVDGVRDAVVDAQWEAANGRVVAQ